MLFFLASCGMPGRSLSQVTAFVVPSITSLTPTMDAAIIPFQAMGIVDVSGADIPDSKILVYTLSNAAGYSESDFVIKHSSAFVNEYPWINETTGERIDHPNHLLGAFPVLFSYGKGGFGVDCDQAVTYKKHVKWALQYADKYFQKDFHFIFQIFGVMQKTPGLLFHSSADQVESISTTKAEDFNADGC